MTDIIEARPQQRVAIPRDCSFHPTDWDVLSRSWFPVARSDEVKNRPTKSGLLDIDLVVYRTGGVARVARDLCFHRGAALSMGWVEGDLIVCPYHGTYPEKRSRNKWLGWPLLDGDNIDDNSAGNRKSEFRFELAVCEGSKRVPQDKELRDADGVFDRCADPRS